MERAATIGSTRLIFEEHAIDMEREYGSARQLSVKPAGAYVARNASVGLARGERRVR